MCHPSSAHACTALWEPCSGWLPGCHTAASHDSRAVSGAEDLVRGWPCFGCGAAGWERHTSQQGSDQQCQRVGHSEAAAQGSSASRIFGQHSADAAKSELHAPAHRLRCHRCAPMCLHVPPGAPLCPRVPQCAPVRSTRNPLFSSPRCGTSGAKRSTGGWALLCHPILVSGCRLATQALTRA